jgi:hypothetical protein
MRLVPLFFLFFISFQLFGQGVDPVTAQSRSFGTDSIWQTYHPLPLSAKDSLVIQIIDSLERQQNLENRTSIMESLPSYRLPVGQLDICLERLIGYNKFEGLKLGLGLETNHHFSNRFKLGGYWRYGLRDKEDKYGGNISFRLDSATNTQVFVRYENDVREDGSFDFQEQPQPFLSRQIYVWHRSNFTYHQMFQAGAARQILPSLQAKAYWKNYRMHGPTFVDETLQPTSVLYNNLGVQFRLAFKEHLFRQRNKLYSLGTRFPVLQVNYERSLPSFSDRNYEAIEFKLNDSFRFRHLGESEIELLGAWRESGGVVNLLASPPSSKSRMLAIYTKNTFATMGVNEFVADRMLAVFWRHNFSPLLFPHKPVKTDIVLAFNAGIGKSEYDDLPGFSARYPSIPKGYYEAGLLVSKLLKLNFLKLGVGAFYRMGPYRFDSFKDNVALKVTVDLGK